MTTNQKILLAGAVFLLATLLVASLGAPILAKFPPIKKAVIKQLKEDKGFSPSPYGPGIDPDAADVTDFAGWNNE